ncbi:MAG TPA: methyltransferase domain-containing protein [Bacillales bacterium]|nr:methyltransferase domain-containing protein [Bacillales bacterium]
MTNDHLLKYYNSEGLWDKAPSEFQIDVANVTLNRIPEDVKTILDVGSGNGVITNQLVGKYDRVCAIDISEEALKYVQAEKVIGSIDQLPFKDNEFDLILISDVLEHLPLPVFKKGIEELKRVAKKYILVVTPFQEKLEFGKMTCYQCSCDFHVNLHIQSITKETIIENFTPAFTIKEMGFSGDEWLHIPRYAEALKSLYHYSNNWVEAVCPQCGTKQETHHKKTEQEFYYAIADTIHEVMDSFRLEEITQNEALFLLEKVNQQTTEVNESFKIEIESDSPINKFELVDNQKWNVDFVNPFYERKHTIYFGYKPYVVNNQNMNLSNISFNNESAYRFVGPKQDANNQALFVIPKFTNSDFKLTIEYLDNSEGQLLLNVYDRNKSYLPVGELLYISDGNIKTKTFKVPASKIKCPPEGFLFELTNSETMKDALSISYIHVDDENQTKTTIRFSHENDKYTVDLNTVAENVIHGNCYLYGYVENADGRAQSDSCLRVQLNINGTLVALQSVMVKNLLIIEIPAEIVSMFIQNNVSLDSKPLSDNIVQWLKSNLTNQKQEVAVETYENRITELQYMNEQYKEIHTKYEAALVDIENKDVLLDRYKEIHAKYEVALVDIQNKDALINRYKEIKEQNEKEIVDFQNKVAELTWDINSNEEKIYNLNNELSVATETINRLKNRKLVDYLFNKEK